MAKLEERPHGPITQEGPAYSTSSTVSWHNHRAPFGMVNSMVSLPAALQNWVRGPGPSQSQAACATPVQRGMTRGFKKRKSPFLSPFFF